MPLLRFETSSQRRLLHPKLESYTRDNYETHVSPHNLMKLYACVESLNHAIADTSTTVRWTSIVDSVTYLDALLLLGGIQKK